MVRSSTQTQRWQWRFWSNVFILAIVIPVCTTAYTGLVENISIAAKEGPVAVQDIAVGDHVWAYDFLTATSQLRTVTRVFDVTFQPTVVLQIFREYDNYTLNITMAESSLLYVINRSSFVKAERLKPGDILQSSEQNHARIRVLSVIPHKLEFVLIFEVDDLHTLYATELCILLHNPNEVEMSPLYRGPLPQYPAPTEALLNTRAYRGLESQDELQAVLDGVGIRAPNPWQHYPPNIHSTQYPPDTNWISASTNPMVARGYAEQAGTRAVVEVDLRKVHAAGSTIVDLRNPAATAQPNLLSNQIPNRPGDSRPDRLRALGSMAARNFLVDTVAAKNQMDDVEIVIDGHIPYSAITSINTLN